MFRNCKDVVWKIGREMKKRQHSWSLNSKMTCLKVRSIWYRHADSRENVLVKALRYKQAGRRFESPSCQWNFSVI